MLDTCGRIYNDFKISHISRSLLLATLILLFPLSQIYKVVKIISGRMFL